MKDTIKRQSMIIISIIGIVVVSLMMGLTYAYQSVLVEYSEGSDSDLSIKAGVLDVSFTATSRINETNLELMNDYTNAKYSEFTIDNNSSFMVSYYISIIDLSCSSALKSSDFKYTLTKVNGNNETFIYTGDFSNLDCSSGDYELMLDGSKYRSLSIGESETLKLYLWLEETNENQNSLENTSFQGKIQINSVFTEDLAETFENPYTEGTLAYSIIENSRTRLNGTMLLEKSITSVGNSISDYTVNGVTYHESSLSMTPDDFSESTGFKSYYFRGNVSDNYVTFAGMCWRIVRIKGNGSIKLILEDKDNTCQEMSEMTSTLENYNEDKGDFDIGKAPYGYNEKYLADYLGYTGGMADVFLNYQTELAKKIDTTLGENATPEQVKNTLSSVLEFGDWCNTEVLKYDSDYKKVLTEEEINYKILNKERFYYDSNVRLRHLIPKEPTLKCNGTIMEDFKDYDSNPTPMYVGTLTADEVIFAGGIVNYTSINASNYNYYLMNDYVNFRSDTDNIIWLTLSPNAFDGQTDHFYNMSNNGYLGSYENEIQTSRHLRPVITLKAGSLVVSGCGTQTDPYMVS